jgi:acyl-CoA hydrolase
MYGVSLRATAIELARPEGGRAEDARPDGRAAGRDRSAAPAIRRRAREGKRRGMGKMSGRTAHVLSAAAFDAAAFVRAGDMVVCAPGASEPLTLIENLLARRHEIGPFRMFLGGVYSGVIRPEHADVIQFFGLGAIGANRALCEAGVMEIIPCHLSDLPHLLARGPLRADVSFVQLAAHPGDGALSLGATSLHMPAAMAASRAIVAELNDQAPWTRARSGVDPEAIDVIVRTTRPLVEIRPTPSAALDIEIARRIAAFVPDGAVLQTGIGRIPSAALLALADRRDLGVHSGVIGDGLIDLIETGAVTNATKAIDRGVSVTGGLLGTRRVYDFARGRTDILVEPVSYTHDPRILGRLDRFVAINSALEVDLTGQVSAEAAGLVYVGAVGGQGDFVGAALASPGGRAIIALPARARGLMSRIVARSQTGVITTARADADVIVTEFGAAELRFQPIRERVRRMIAIAHPDDRDRLDREARDVVAGF